MAARAGFEPTNLRS